MSIKSQKRKKSAIKRLMTLLILMTATSLMTACSSARIVTKPNLKWQFKDDSACLNKDGLRELSEYINSLKKD